MNLACKVSKKAVMRAITEGGYIFWASCMVFWYGLSVTEDGLSDRFP